MVAITGLQQCSHYVIELKNEDILLGYSSAVTI